jgi:hypothetical protein
LYNNFQDAGRSNFMSRYLCLWYRSVVLLTVLLLLGGSVYAQNLPQLPQSVAGQNVVFPVKKCSQLSTIDLSDIGGQGSRIISATESSSNGIAACQLEGRLAPSIGFKIMLPLKSWGSRYLQLGCGGLCGRASLQVGAADSCVPLDSGGFVIAATDMGHQGMSGDFGRNPQQREDFAYRAEHLTSIAAKKLIRLFYGRSQSFSYFTGCSDGGREALVEAQRYPDDFDGVIAGAAAMNFQVQNAMHHSWLVISNRGADGKAILTADRLPLIHQAALAQCDKLDGQADGLISDPLSCHFDPGVLQCPAALSSTRQASCLSAAEVGVLRRFYQGPVDAKTGRHLSAGAPLPGSELAWSGVFVPERAGDPVFSEIIALSSLRNLNFVDTPPADFKLTDLHFDQATFDRLRARHTLFDATNPDLTVFANAGHKLILWHGLADEHISPLNSIAYHTAVQSYMGRDKANGFERLYLLPGVYHCGGGEGPSAVDLLTPMIAWVEQGKAPQALMTYPQNPASQPRDFGQPTSQKNDKAPAPKGIVPAAAPHAAARALFPYPYLAHYDGHGNTDDIASYQPVLPLQPFVMPDWLGADFYQPYRAGLH